MQSLKAHILERGAAFLSNPKIQARMDKQTRDDIASGKKEFFAADFYIRKKLHSTSGIVDIIKETDALQPSVTNIDKGKLYPGVYLGLVGISIGYGFDANSDKADGIYYTSAIKDATQPIPLKLVNSEFTLKAGGNLIAKLRTKKFLSLTPYEYAINANDENVFLLPTPKLIAGEKKIDASLEYGDNGPALADGNHFLEIGMLGVYVGDK